MMSSIYSDLRITTHRHLSAEELAVSEFRRAIAEATLVIGWVTKNLLSRALPCFGMHAKPLVPAVFAIVSTHQSAVGPRGGLWPIFLICNP
jgi:hypothetical protein